MTGVNVIVGLSDWCQCHRGTRWLVSTSSWDYVTGANVACLSDWCQRHRVFKWLVSTPSCDWALAVNTHTYLPPVRTLFCQQRAQSGETRFIMVRVQTSLLWTRDVVSSSERCVPSHYTHGRTITRSQTRQSMFLYYMVYSVTRIWITCDVIKRINITLITRTLTLKSVTSCVWR